MSPGLFEGVSRNAAPAALVWQRRPTSRPVRVNYHCDDMFSASGYGEAGRAYVRALSAAGVIVRVSDTFRTRRRVEDAIVASLIGHDQEADFNIFHGIPSHWAQTASAYSNVIAVTVWEADQIPEAWYRPLSQVLDVWVPCSYNLRSFERLARAPYRLPHALPVRDDPRVVGDIHLKLRIKPTDFVFYSIFEWQDRKNPRGLI